MKGVESTVYYQSKGDICFYPNAYLITREEGIRDGTASQEIGKSRAYPGIRKHFVGSEIEASPRTMRDKA